MYVRERREREREKWRDGSPQGNVHMVSAEEDGTQMRKNTVTPDKLDHWPPFSPIILTKSTLASAAVLRVNASILI